MEPMANVDDNLHSDLKVSLYGTVQHPVFKSLRIENSERPQLGKDPFEVLQLP